MPASGAWQPKTKWPSGDRPERLGYQPEVDEVEPHAAELLRVTGRPQPHLFDHCTFLPDLRQQFAEGAGEKGGLHGDEFVVDKFADQPECRFHLFREVEIHDRASRVPRHEDVLREQSGGERIRTLA